jgi:hypothetical protein
MVKEPLAQLNVEELIEAPAASAHRIRAMALAVRQLKPRAIPVEAAPLKATQPGKERWSIKTGLDSEAVKVGKIKGSASKGKFHFVPTTVEEMVEVPRPADMQPPTKNFKKYEKTRAKPVESTIWRLEAEIIAMKLEDDGDMHIVLRGASGTLMIAETPTARAPFVQEASPWLKAMAAVRQRLNERFGAKTVPLAFSADTEKLVPMAAFTDNGAMAEAQPLRLSQLIEDATPFAVKIDPTPVRVTGVGFFDRIHGQNGVAKNGVELHPVLDITFLD